MIRASDLPVRIMLRLNESYTTTGGEFVRLVGLAEEYVSLGAEGVVFGFLDADLEVDVLTCQALSAVAARRAVDLPQRDRPHPRRRPASGVAWSTCPA